MENYIFTETKEVVMTADKTVTTISQKLEEIDPFGRRRVIDASKSIHEKDNCLSDSFKRTA